MENKELRGSEDRGLRGFSGIVYDFMWTLDDALEFINIYQKAAMANGWYLALAGGVLNRGYSNNDLDLVAVPRTDNSAVYDLHMILTWEKVIDKETGICTDLNPCKFIKMSKVFCAEIHEYSWNGRKIKIVVIGSGDPWWR